MDETTEPKRESSAEGASEGEVTQEFRRLGELNLDRVGELIHETECGLLVLAGEKLSLLATDLRELLDESECSVMLLREV